MQRAVLDAVHEAIGEDGTPQWVSVDEVDRLSTESTLTPSRRESLRRAMRTLARAGHVELGDVRRKSAEGYRWMLAVRLPLTREQRLAEAEHRAAVYRSLARSTRAKYVYDQAIAAQESVDALRASVE